MSEKDAPPAPEPKKKTAGSKQPIPQDVELDGLMSEIESDLREDELKRIWKKYGTVFVTMAVVFLAAVAAYEGWRAFTSREHAAVALTFEEALTAAAQKNYDESRAKFAEVVKSGDKPYAALARLTDAGVRIEQDDVDGAIAVYAELIADPKVDPTLRDMAVILKALHSLDREDPKKLEAELAGLIKDSTFKHSATELTALLAAKQGDTARAAGLTQGLIDDAQTPQSMRGRASELTALYKAGIVPAALPPPALDAGKAPSVMDLVAPAAEAEPTPARPGPKAPSAKP